MAQDSEFEMICVYDVGLDEEQRAVKVKYIGELQ